MTLDADDLAQLADMIADRIADDVLQLADAIAERLRERPPSRYVDARRLAVLLDVERDWIYRHADRLGGVRLGGPRGRLRFDQTTLGQHLVPVTPTPAATRASRPARRAARPARRHDQAPIRLLSYHVESPEQQRSSGRAARQRPRPDTGR